MASGRDGREHDDRLILPVDRADRRARSIFLVDCCCCFESPTLRVLVALPPRPAPRPDLDDEGNDEDCSPCAEAKAGLSWRRCRPFAGGMVEKRMTRRFLRF